MDRSEVLSSFFDEKIVAVLKEILRKRDTFGVRDVARASKISVATTYRILQKLSSLGIVNRINKGNLSYYALQRNSPFFEEIYSLVIGVLPTPVDLFKQKLLGESKDTRFHISKEASGEKKLFVISNSLQPDVTIKMAEEVKAETGKMLKYVILAPEQFRQMREMNIIK